MSYFATPEKGRNKFNGANTADLVDLDQNVYNDHYSHKL